MDRGIDELCVGQIDLISDAVGEVIYHHSGDSGGIRDGGPVPQVDEYGLHVLAVAHHEVPALPAHGDRAHLGLLAQTREMFYEDAEEWYLLALDKYEALGDRRSAGDECRQLGVLFHEQKRLDEAEGWYNRAREIFEDLGDVQRTARTFGQLGMVAEERDDLSSALEWVARTYRLAAEHGLPLLPQVKSHLARLRSKYGDDRFNTWWRGYTGGDPPTDLDTDSGTVI